MASKKAMFEILQFWSDDQQRSGAWNMAIDQALLEVAEHPILRVYEWDQPTVSIGYSQSLSRLRDALPDWPVVRRWTGGGVVFHKGDFTYTLLVPAGHFCAELRPVESYRLIHGSLTAMLNETGSSGCRLAGPEDLKDLPFCFEAPALYDVVSGSMKVAGAGQRRGKLGWLHQGSVQSVLLPENFWRRWAETLGSNVWKVETPLPSVLERAEELVRLRYDLSEWLESREDRL